MSVGADTPNSGVDLIAAERRRQVSEEGWTGEHDAGHASDALALAAVSYATPAGLRLHQWRDTHAGLRRVPRSWPWSADFWKPTPDDRVRELVKAGALIAAEIDRQLNTLENPS